MENLLVKLKSVIVWMIADGLYYHPAPESFVLTEGVNKQQATPVVSELLVQLLFIYNRIAPLQIIIPNPIDRVTDGKEKFTRFPVFYVYDNLVPS